MKKRLQKANFYVLSLSILFFLLFILSVPAPDTFAIAVDLNQSGTSSVYATIWAVAFVYSLGVYFRFSWVLKGSLEIPFEIKEIRDINYEQLTFLATYIVPLITFTSGNTRHHVVLFLLLILMGAIYVRTDLFYTNPTLGLLGFRIYKADGAFKHQTRRGIILISKDALKKNEKVSYLKLDDRIYFVQRTINGSS